MVSIYAPSWKNTKNNYSADGRWVIIVNEVRSAELAIITSYPTRESRMIVLLKTPHKRHHNVLRNLIVIFQAGSGGYC